MLLTTRHPLPSVRLLSFDKGQHRCESASIQMSAASLPGASPNGSVLGAKSVKARLFVLQRAC